MSSGPIRVAIVEDDRVTREGLAQLVQGTPGFACEERFASVEQALAGLRRTAPPHVLLLDIHLPGRLGSQSVGLFRERFPAMQVVMLTVYASEDRILEAICNGACGYLLKKTPPAELLAAVGDAHQGGSPMSSEVARKVVTLLRQVPRAERDETPLAGHELRLLKLLAEGHSYQACGSRMNVSVNTIRNYIRSIYEKLQVHSRSEAVSKALRGRLIS